MTKERSAKLTFVLSMIAAGLALTAAAIEYTNVGSVKLSLIAAAVFLLAFGFAARSRSK